MSLTQDGKLGNSVGCMAEEHFGGILLACHASLVLRGCEVLGGVCSYSVTLDPSVPLQVSL